MSCTAIGLCVHQSYHPHALEDVWTLSKSDSRLLPWTPPADPRPKSPGSVLLLCTYPRVLHRYLQSCNHPPESQLSYGLRSTPPPPRNNSQLLDYLLVLGQAPVFPLLTPPHHLPSPCCAKRSTGDTAHYLNLPPRMPRYSFRAFIINHPSSRTIAID